MLHGLFHTQMLIAGMATTAFGIAVELLVIIAPSVLTAVLLVLRFKENRNGEL